MQTNKRRMALIGVVGVPARYGGLETLAQQLVLHLGDSYELTVYNSRFHYQAHERPTEWKGANIHYLPLKANGIQSIFYDMWAMLHAVRHHKVLIVLGVSGCLLLPLLKLFFPRTKILVNIDGLEWSRPKWGPLARWFLRMSEWVAVKTADLIIADNEAIKSYVAARYHRSAHMIAYGGDHVEPVPYTASDLKKYPFLKRKYAVKACRIEPENKLEMILEALASFPELDLVIIGNWADSRFGRQLRHHYEGYAHIHLLDFIRDARELDRLRSHAYVYLHGHSAGGTNPSLVEAMNLGLPVIAFGGTIFNRNTTQGQAWYASTSAEWLSQVQALSPTSRRALGERMLGIGQQHYTWKVIAAQYAAAVEEACQAADQAALLKLKA